MVKLQQILGMNARVQLYTALNSKAAKRYGFSKLRAKNFLRKHSIKVPELYARVQNQEELRDLDWHNIQGSFAVKPASGSAGKGIIVIKRKKDHDTWVDVANKEYTANDLDLHVSDILDGQYSTWGSRHMALIEERIPIHPDLTQYVQMGTPDVRIILYRKIPVMAMIRLPTEASNGRANLDQGAIALGIDMGTGKSTYGVAGKKKIITYLPHNNLPTAGLTIPFWNEALKTAVRVANATELTYMGCDIFLHPVKGPMVAEVNAFPGLSIQLANRAGLRTRLQRLEGIYPRNVLHAIKLAQSLFAENYPGVGSEVDRTIIGLTETVQVQDHDDELHDTLAVINTRRQQSAISEKLISQLKLNAPQDLLWNTTIEGEGHVPVMSVTFKLKDRLVTTPMTVTTQLNHKKHEVEIGKRDLHGFLIKVE